MADTSVIEIGPSGEVVVAVTTDPDIVSVEIETTFQAIEVADAEAIDLTVQTGPAGPADMLGIGTILTGAAGSAASATITGTFPNRKLNLTIPLGYGVKSGGATGDVLQKLSNADYDTGWIGSTNANTPNTIVRRAIDGSADFSQLGVHSTPTVAHHAARKDYVDALGTTTSSGDTVVRRDVNGFVGATGFFQTGPQSSGVADLTRKDYVDAGDAARVAKSGDTMTGTLTLPEFDDLLVGNQTNKYIIPNVNALAMDPFASMWHDLLAFGKHIPLPVFEVSDDGAAWTAATLPALFSSKDAGASTLIDTTTSRRHARFSWNNANMLSFSSGRWLLIAWGWGGAGNIANRTVRVESSSDGITWATRHLSTYAYDARPVWHYVSDYGSDKWLRVTTTWDGIGPVNNIVAASMRLLSNRWGDQGAGSELKYPYDWDSSRTMYFVRARSESAPAQADDLTRKDYVDGQVATRAAGNHTHTSIGITDSTTVGRSVLTAADAASARTAIGAGTSSLALGTTSTTAAAGNHTHTAAGISDSTTVGRSVLTAADAAAARTAIGAGTSSLAIGTTSTTAKAGNYTPPAATEIQTGIVELATAAEVVTGTDNTRAVHPAGLAGLTSNETRKGLVELATAAETTTGTDNTRAVHPAGLKVELDKKVTNGGGVIEIRSMTQSAYDALTPKVTTTLYVITPG